MKTGVISKITLNYHAACILSLKKRHPLLDGEMADFNLQKIAFHAKSMANSEMGQKQGIEIARKIANIREVALRTISGPEEVGGKIPKTIAGKTAVVAIISAISYPFASRIALSAQRIIEGTKTFYDPYEVISDSSKSLLIVLAAAGAAYGAFCSYFKKCGEMRVQIIGMLQKD